MLTQLAARWDDDVSYQRQPVKWLQDKPREHAWSAQRRIMESVLNNRYTAVPSAHDLGKSFIGSRIGAWWIDSYPAGDAFLVSTAPTAAQVSAILWREIAKTHRKAALRGRINRAGYPQWYIDGELVAYGRKPADYEESAFQGIHAENVLVVIDEAGGVARNLFDSVDALATNEYARVLAIGNPDDPGSHFATICKPGSGWNVIHLDGLRSPNMTYAAIVGPDPANPVFPLTAALMRAEGIAFSTEEIPPQIRPMLLAPLWVEERLQRWAGMGTEAHLDYDPDELGEVVRRRCATSSLVQAKVRGIFPTAASTGVIPLGWIQQAINRWRDWHDAGADLARMAEPGDRVVGVDVAYSGVDETVVAVRNGNIVSEIHRYRHADTVETADYATAHLCEPRALAVVDVIGIGAGVYDTLRRYRRDGVRDPETGAVTIPAGAVGRSIPFNAAAQSHRTDKIGEFKFRNDRSAAWWKMREALDPSKGSKVMLPDDERLLEEMVAVQYNHLVGGVIQVESKDDIRKRLGRSTDTADAVIQAFWPSGMSAGQLDEALEAPTERDGKAARARERQALVVSYPGYTPLDPDEMEDFGVPGLNTERGWAEAESALRAGDKWSSGYEQYESVDVLD